MHYTSETGNVPRELKERIAAARNLGPNSVEYQKLVALLPKVPMVEQPQARIIRRVQPTPATSPGSRTVTPLVMPRRRPPQQVK